MSPSCAAPCERTTCGALNSTLLCRSFVDIGCACDGCCHHLWSPAPPPALPPEIDAETTIVAAITWWSAFSVGIFGTFLIYQSLKRILGYEALSAMLNVFRARILCVSLGFTFLHAFSAIDIGLDCYQVYFLISLGEPGSSLPQPPSFSFSASASRRCTRLSTRGPARATSWPCMCPSSLHRC